MLKFVTIDKNSKDYLEFARLYYVSFPKNEQMPIIDLVKHSKYIEMEACYIDNEFCGFYSAVKSNSILCLLYFAIEENMRDKGMGSMILDGIKKKHKNMIIILDVEKPEDDADNETQRLSRKHFYLKNGFIDTGIEYKWRNMDYQIMAYGGYITKKRYEHFWKLFGE